MTSQERTAYPKLRQLFSEEELRDCYGLNEADKAFVRQHANGHSQRLTLLVMYKTRSQLGYFPPIHTIPNQLKEFLATAFQLPLETPLLDKANQKKTRYRYRRMVRQKLNCTQYTPEGAKFVEPLVRHAAYTQSDPADLINVATAALFDANIELPAFTTLDRLAGHVRQNVHSELYQKASSPLTQEQRNRLDQLLEVEPNQSRSGFTQLKQSPGPATLTQVREWANHLAKLDDIINPTTFLAELTHTKIRQFSAEATALELGDFRAIRQPGKRYTLLLCLLQQTQTHTRDELTIMFLKRMKRTTKVAQEQLRILQEKQREQEEKLMGVFGEVLQQARHDNEDISLGQHIRLLLDKHGGLDALEQTYQTVAVCHQNNFLPLLWPIHARNRSVLFNVLALLEIESATRDSRLLDAFHFVCQSRHQRRDTLPAKLDLSFLSQRWQAFVCRQIDGQPVYDRRSLEVCVLIAVAEALGRCDLYVKGTEAYADYRTQMIPMPECEERFDEYCQAIGLPATSSAFAQTLKQALSELAMQVDQQFPANGELSIDADGIPHLKQQKAAAPPSGAREFEKAVQERLPERHLLDILKHVHHWTSFTRHFGPLSGSEPKLNNPLQRYLFTVFGYGCNLGASQTAHHAPDLINRYSLQRINAQHVTTHKLETASNDIITEYTRFPLPHLWGNEKVAIADGTHMSLRENNLMGETHIRYGGYGGIAYHHISATYIALFSQFITCGVWEGVHILDALLKNDSVLQPDTLHADTHGQSEPIFALAYLLGIELFPRMRTWNDVDFYRPDKTTTYQHLEAIFKKPVNWELIERHWKDMMQVAISIQSGKVLPSMLLRKLGSHNRKNNLYRAFRELGRVRRTLFLLQYISEADLRHSIRAETTKVESYNDFLDWISFGGSVIKSGDPVEQEKQIKYSNLVANAIMLHNVADLTNVLEAMSKEGFEITEALAALLSPYGRQHLRRFGQFSLDMEVMPPPLNPRPIPMTKNESKS
ncbi:MAG: Tn3 family transposase [Thiolinea sp.]